jgi:hypothetical protein
MTAFQIGLLIIFVEAALVLIYVPRLVNRLFCEKLN